ncbi:carboxymuconolactone decarboxylase family protein [Planctomycetes bacterium K23_9]|uniref:Carboxymuconolactone decarboxylase family protein n=1 Tax=Stieleria marina TaxID=1930275 RepID=A0A517NUP1_9BACT|nr:Carboxymuconolactone decarboxylase family protein [Planctomycetes bacterium K23_9]
MSRIETVDPSTATGRAKELLDGIKVKLGVTPNMMRAMANSPSVLGAYLQFSGALADGDLSTKTRERISLTVAQENLCDYCLGAHSAIGKSVGLSADQIRDARHAAADDPKSDAILKFASKVVTKRGRVSDADLSVLKAAGVSDGEIAEIVANTALNLFTNYFNHVSEVEVDFPAAESLEPVADSACSSCQA